MMNDNSNFIKTIMKEELDNGVVNHILTRFPPEPNAYLHIGHARAIIMNFELAKCFDGATNLRFDDTNPSKEDTEYIEAIKKDIAWLGYTPKSIHYGSEYFERTYEKAKLLIKKGLAFVDDLTQEQLSEYRGSINEPGKPSPFRNRSVEENLRLFEEMKEGKYANGEKTLRAKIDMASPNINMRDPVIYRIMHVTHHQTKDKWCIYPMYDFAHPLQDAFEGITHSLCSIEFEDHRPLYEWVIANCEVDAKPRQIEWGRLGITHMIMSKRYLKKLVDEKVVEGYDDPRMPTLVGLRRRGFTPNAIKEFILSTGLSKVNSTVDYGMLEHFLREDLKLKTTRPMAVINPLKVIITNYPEGQIEYVDAPNNMENEALGTHKMAFGRELYIEREDFCEVKPNKHWKRLSKDIEVRLMHAYFIKCNEVIKDENGEIVGVDVDIAKEIAKELGKELVIKDIAFDSIINEVRTGKADIGAAGISYSDERAKKVDFSINYSVSKQVVIVKNDSFINSINDINDKKIAVQLGSVADTYVTENYKNAEIVRQKKYLAAIEDLKVGKVDLVVMDELPAKEIIEKNSGIKILDGELTSDSYGMIVKKGNTELLEAVNKVLNRLSSDGSIDNFIIKHTEE